MGERVPKRKPGSTFKSAMHTLHTAALPLQEPFKKSSSREVTGRVFRTLRHVILLHLLAERLNFKINEHAPIDRTAEIGFLFIRR